MLYQLLQIKKETEENIQVDIQLNVDHPIFKGHFPEQPVLPGACMVQILKEVLQQANNCELEFQKASNIKFISLIIPKENTKLTFHIQTKALPEGLLTVSSTLYDGEVASMKFSGTYKIK
ncbi:MAG: 3-hydroxyacyl-ACP dehydratase [Bacteroidota bacterium]